VTSVDLSTYVRTGRFDLPEPTRTAHPPNSLLAQEASGVTYDWDTDTLFVVGDGGTSVVQVSKTDGHLLDSMTLAPGPSPQGTDFFDTEGITYIGGNKFVLVEERDRQANLFTYTAGGILHKTDVQTVKLGTTIGNIGLEGVSFDPSTNGPAGNGFIFVKEKDPESVFQTNIDFAAGTATNGSPSATGSTNLFDPALANLVDFSDVFALSNLPSLNGQPDSSHLLILSQESGQIINVDRSGNIFSTLTIVSDPGNPLSVSGQTHEGVTMDRDGNLYVVSENGGGDANHPQLWVYAHTDAPNHAPTAVTLSNAVTSIPDNTLTNAALKLADILVTDDGLGNNHLTVTGADASFFQIIGTALFLKAGTVLNHTTKPAYNITVNVDDTTVGATPDATTNYTLTITAPPAGGAATLIITEVAAWSSGNSPVQADWFEVTNIGTATANITGWTMDDDSDNPNSALLSGITNINPNESVIFLEVQPGANAATIKTAFVNTWFAGNAPPGLQIGTYAQGAAGGVGLSTNGDHVNLFSGVNGTLQAKVTFGASDNVNPLQTFDNSTLLNNTAILTLSQVGVHGAFVATNDANEIGSPGTIGTTPIVTITATDNTAAEEPAGNTGKFRISRTGGTVGPLTVSYTISGSANNSDYTPELTGVATIPSGQSFVDITITAVEDTLIEGPETLTLTIGDSGSYDVGAQATATVNIADNQNVPPFLGVAAGDASTNSAVLWTRVDQQAAVPVHAQVATAPDFSGSLMSFAGVSDPAKDYTVKLQANGLTPGTTYYYRFVNDVTSETSGTGTFKTVPLANTGATPLHFGFSGDNDGLMRPYALGNVLPSQQLDFYLNLGDLIYETASNVNGNNGTSYLNSPSVTLSNDSLSFNGVPRAFVPGSAPFATHTQLKADYEKKYRENFLPVNTNGQNSLQVMYAGQGNYTTWDNHELGNRKYIDGGAPAGGSVGGPTGVDMASGRGVDARNNGTGNPGNKNDAADLLLPADPDLASLGGFMNKATGFQTLEKVLFEYQPLADRGIVNAPGDSRINGTPKLYSAVNWGRNALFVNTDSRSYRDIRLKTADASADDTGPRADNKNRTFLSATQLAWLKQTLLDAQNNGTTWKFVSVSDPIDQLGPIGGSLNGVTSATMAPFSGNPAYGPVSADGGKSYMGGYRAERNDLLKFIADNHITNVVFLSTDDHQNRVNELYYSPSGDTGNQSSYVKVPYTFAIVCGPLGATGPDLFLNHTFAGAQGAANLIANAQVAAGIDPIGLQNYPGLHDLFRDGDPSANTSAQPVDFYSPDTFNFTVLDVSPSGKTLTIKSVGMSSTAQNAAIESANGPQAKTIFSFQIDGFQSLSGSTKALRDELSDALAGATNKTDITRLTDAIRKLDDASNPDVWQSDGNHLVCTRGDAIFNRYKDAVQKLMDMIQDTSTDGIPDAMVQNWINTLVAIDRDLAQTAITEATDPGKIAKALKDLAAGDADAVGGSFDRAIEDYRKAWNGVTDCNSSKNVMRIE